MNHEELIAKAFEHAKDCGAQPELLVNPRICYAAVVTFEGNKPGSRVEIYLDRETGKFISAAIAPAFSDDESKEM